MMRLTFLRGGIGFAVVVLATMLASTVSAAADPTPAEKLVAQIEQAVLAAQAANGAADKISNYEAARDNYLYLMDLKADANATEAPQLDAAVAELSDAGITADILTSDALSARLDLLGPDGKLNAGDALDDRVKVQALIASLQAPSLKVSSLARLADIDASTDPEGALAALNTAVDAAKQIGETESKNAALNAIAQTAARLGGASGLALSDTAIAGMWPSRDRGYARYAVARNELAGTPEAKLKDAQLAQASAKLIDSDLRRALTLAQAIDPESEQARANALNAVLAAALKANDHAALLDLSTSYADDSDQQDAIGMMVEAGIAANRMMDVVQLTAQLPAGPTRARLEFKLAAGLQAAHYDKMASDAYARGSELVGSMSGAQRDAALGEAITGAIALDKLDDGLTFFKELSSSTIAEQPLRKLGKALADADDLDNAQLVLASLTEADDRDYVLSAIAQVRTKDGDLNFGLSTLPKLVDRENRGRVAAEVVRQYAKTGDFDHAISTGKAIESANYQVQAFLRVADAARDVSNTAIVQKTNDLALQSAKAASPADLRDKLLALVVASYAKSGDAKTAQDVANLIVNDKDRTKALSSIATEAALRGDAPASLALLASIPSDTDSDASVTEPLLALAQDPANLPEITKRIRGFGDDMLRVQTFRAIAELQLRRLDQFHLGMGRGLTRDYTVADPNAVSGLATPPPVLSKATFTADPLSLYQIDKSPDLLSGYGFPKLDYSVDDIRRSVPTPKRGYVGVTLAQLSPYNDKFLEDLPGGQTGLGYAAAAQGAVSARIIVIESGVYTLGSLVDELASSGRYPLVTRDNDVVTLRVPLLVGKNATLILSGQEAAAYRLSATAGSFISVAGHLFVVDTRVESWDEDKNVVRSSNAHTRDVFRPFIVAWSGGVLDVGGSVLDSLGYAAPKSFGLAFSTGPTSVVGEHSTVTPPGGLVVGNSFHNFEYGYYSYEAADVAVVGNEYRDNIVYGVDPHDRSKRLLLALNTMYGTEYKHGMIISREVDGSWMVGNVSFDNAGSGFMLDRDSTDTLIYGNVGFDNHGDGLTFFESSCNLAVSNHFFDNARDGIKLRNSWNLGLFGNQLAHNTGAGINAYTARIEGTSEHRNFVEDPYVPYTTFVAGNNAIAGNAAGLKVVGVNAFSTFGQTFKGQRGPLLSGDARPLEGSMLRFNDNGGSVVLRSSTCDVMPPAYYCGFRTAGVLGNFGLDSLLTSRSDPCTAQIMTTGAGHAS